MREPPALPGMTARRTPPRPAARSAGGDTHGGREFPDTFLDCFG